MTGDENVRRGGGRSGSVCAWIALHLAKRGSECCCLMRMGRDIRGRVRATNRASFAWIWRGMKFIRSVAAFTGSVEGIVCATAKQELFQKTGVLWLAESGNAQLQATVGALRRIKLNSNSSIALHLGFATAN